MIDIRDAAEAAEQERAAVQQRLANAPTERQRIVNAAASREPARVPSIDQPRPNVRSAIQNAPRIDDPRIQPQPRAPQPNVRSAIEAKLPVGDARLQAPKQMGAGPVIPAESPLRQQIRGVAPVREAVPGITSRIPIRQPNLSSVPNGAPAAAIEAQPRGPVEQAAYKAGQATRSILSNPWVKRAGAVGAGAAALDAAGSYRIDDPAVDSSAGGTLKALGRGDFAGAGRSASKGALETLMDAGGFVADTADVFLPGQPAKGAYDRFLKGQFGEQLNIASPAPQAAAQPAAQARPVTQGLPGSPTDKLALSVRDAAANGIDSFNYDFGPGNRGALELPRRPVAQRPVAQSAQPRANNVTNPAAGTDTTHGTVGAPTAVRHETPLQMVARDARENGLTSYEFDVGGQKGVVGAGARDGSGLIAPDNPNRLSIDDLAAPRTPVMAGDGSYIAAQGQLSPLVAPGTPATPIYSNSSRVNAMAGVHGIEVVHPGERFDEVSRKAVPNDVQPADTQRYIDARSRHAIDQFDGAAVPSRVEGVKGDYRLREQQLQNEGGARVANISASERRHATDSQAATAANRLAHDERQGQKPFTVEDGQDVYTDPQTGALVARKRPSRVFDPNTKQYIAQPEQQPSTVAIPAGAIKKLRENPKLTADFDAKYGKGAAARVLGGN